MMATITDYKLPAVAFGAGIMCLLLGALFYILFRPPESTMFLDALGLEGKPLAYGIMPSMPSFIHTLAFSLLTVSLVWENRCYALLSCLSWVLINLAFECAQLLPSVELLGGGVFDIADIVAIFFGGLCAVAFVLILKRKETQQ